MQVRYNYDELVDVFRRWKLDYLTNPESYEDINDDDVEAFAYGCADLFVKLLTHTN